MYTHTSSPQLVNEEGGFDAVCRERRWTKISVKMGFAPGKAIGSHLRAHYERILYPYNLFQTGANLLVRRIVFFFTAEAELSLCSVDVYLKTLFVVVNMQAMTGTICPMLSILFVMTGRQHNSNSQIVPVFNGPISCCSFFAAVVKDRKFNFHFESIMSRQSGSKMHCNGSLVDYFLAL